MEANGVREYADATRRGQFVRRAIAAAVLDVILPRLTEALILEALAAGTVTRDLCARTLVYLKARCHYGVCDPARLGPLPQLWVQILGDHDLARLDDLFARLIWATDGDNDTLDHYATEYRQIIGPPPAPPSLRPSGSRGGESSGEGEKATGADDNHRPSNAADTGDAENSTTSGDWVSVHALITGVLLVFGRMV